MLSWGDVVSACTFSMTSSLMRGLVCPPRSPRLVWPPHVCVCVLSVVLLFPRETIADNAALASANSKCVCVCVCLMVGR